MAYSKQGPKLYFGELMGAMLLYGGALVLRHAYRAAPAGLLKTVILLSPILPVLLAALAIVRFYQRMDEMHRRQTLENVAFAALVCGLSSISLPFLESIGLPHLGIIWAWPAMGAGWLLIAAWRGWRQSVTDIGLGASLRRWPGSAALVAIPTALYALAAPSLGWPHKGPFLILLATAIFLGLSGWRIFRSRP